MNHPSLKAVKSKSTRIKCAHITWKVLEEMRIFFDQRLGPNDLTNKGPRRLTSAGSGVFIGYVWRNKLLDLVTMPRHWNNKDTGENWATHQSKGRRSNMQEHGVLPGAVQMTTGPKPYSPPAGDRTRYKTPQGKGWQAPNPEHRHLMFIKFMVRLLQKYPTPFFQKY